ncbi:MAG: exodeoxyribonuclease V subunit gamma [Desulfovibrionaceae bacterium]
MPEPSLRLIHGNRLEILADRLAASLAAPPSESPLARSTAASPSPHAANPQAPAAPWLDPMEPERIVVQSKGMERYLAMHLARRLGVCANVAFPFPVGQIYDLFKAVLPDVPDESPFAQQAMAWRIMAALPSLLPGPAFAPLRRYAEHRPLLGRLQLCERIASLFDQYLIFRPDVITAWEHSESMFTTPAAPREAEAWQAPLWRAVAQGHPSVHRAALQHAFHRALDRADRAGTRPPLPRRLSVFGISSLPPFHLDVLADLSRFCAVDIYYLNPCREYWFDIRSPRATARLAARHGVAPETFGDEGHPLLASLGGLGRQFLEGLFERDVLAAEDALFDAPAEGIDPDAASPDPARQPLLARLQDDILNLCERRAPDARPPVAARDRSVRIHRCHSPMREMEVLRDQLLDMLAADAGLAPRDILVMMPDVELYAPYIQAVFDAAPGARGAGGGAPRIPYSIADRGVRGQGVAARAVFELLGLPASRLEASRVLALLDLAPVRRRFGLSEADMDLVRDWVCASGVRWGENSAARAATGAPPFTENSWESGLQRLALGYALEDDALWRGVKPLAVEGADARTLGRFLDFVQAVCAFVRDARRERPMASWRDMVCKALDGFLTPDDADDTDLAVLRKALDGMARDAAAAGYDAPAPVDCVAHVLAQAVDGAASARGFLSGGVTFSSLVPMRSVPFRVVWLAGMADAAFPRRDRRPGFDLMAAAPRPGDRSPGADDRHLFLEALISARDVFGISYVGMSARDNAVIPPSTLVGEMLDCIADNYVLDDAAVSLGDAATDQDALVAHLTVTHRLQAFHPAYFSGAANAPLFSYSRADRDGATALAAQTAPQPFAPLPPDAPQANDAAPEDEGTPLDATLAELLAFYRHPGKAFLRALGIRLGNDAQHIEDVERLDALDGLEGYTLGERLLNALEQGTDPAILLADARAANLLPPGEAGAAAFEAVRREAEPLAAQRRERAAGAALPPASGVVRAGAWTLSGHAAGLYPGGLLRCRFAKLSGKHLVTAWIEHLFANAVRGQAGVRTHVLGRDGAHTFSPMAAPAAASLLGQLLDLRRAGLAAPLPFAPKTAWKYVDKLDATGDGAKAIKDAASQWEGAAYQGAGPGEGDDPSWRQCFKGREPLAEPGFADLAEAVFGPLRDHLEA